MGTVVGEYTNVNNILFAEALSVAQVLVAAGATKVDPNSLEGAAPTTQGDYQRITLTNHTVVGTTMDQALTYSLPLIGLQGVAATVGWQDLIKFLIKASAAPAADMRVWCGLSEGGVAANHKGFAVGMGYSAGNWGLYRASDTGASWSAATAAAAVDATTRAASITGQYSATTGQATHSSHGLTSALAPINVTNVGMTAALAINAPAFTHFFIGFDWITGAGGSDGTTVDVKGIATCQPLTSIPNVS